MKKLFLFVVCCLLSTVYSFSEEGMWIPSLLKALEGDMQKIGCKLSAEDIYSINKSSLKDAVLQFGGGCTGEMISGEGLLVTNHHCGYGQIQSHSTVEHDYLTNGFWAKERKDELACPGLTVTFIIRIEDVTAKVLEGVAGDISETKRDSIIQVRGKKIEKEATEGTHYTARMRQFYYGNEFYLFVTETFKDVRMVGAPPESIGNFGGDTDNWMWPRHTGDFSLFRVYANKDNKPADYSADNIPYKPKYFLPISLKGIQDNDFALVFGFPGRTTEYLPSPAVEMIQKVSDPIRVKAREKRLAVWEEDMKKSPEIRIKYSAKHNGVSNYYKKWTGEIRGLEKANGIMVKQEIERNFQEKVSKNPEWNKKYGTLLADLKTNYEKITPYQKVADYFPEAISAVEIIRYANSFKGLIETKPEELAKKLEQMKTASRGFYKDYSVSTDQKLFSELLKLYYDNIDKSMHPEIFTLVQTKYKGSFEKYAEMVYKKSMFTSEEEVKEFLETYSVGKAKAVLNDPAYILARSAYGLLESRVQQPFNSLQDKINRLQRDYMAALRVVFPEKKYYPDANSTLRVSFGTIGGYEGMDGIKYYSYTTLDGIMEKENPNNKEFVVPQKLKELYQKKDYGQYADKDGKVHVGIISAQHTTGGNSGSPLIDANGNLIGVNFDRNWEGTANDIIYDDTQGRSIIVDIRYVLFVIDKFAGATNLINEMKIIK